MLTDRRPKPYSLPVGMGFTLVGLLLLSVRQQLSRCCWSRRRWSGIGSSVFHPESSRIARMASGGRHGLAQSVFQVGGNAGSAIGPLLAAFIVLPRGQSSIAWFSLAALLAIVCCWPVSAAGIAPAGDRGGRRQARAAAIAARGCRAARSRRRSAILMLLIFSKYFYSGEPDQLLHVLPDRANSTCRCRPRRCICSCSWARSRSGTFIGGPIGDRIGRKYVIWCSILGVLPFTLMLPYADLFWTGVLSVFTKPSKSMTTTVKIIIRAVRFVVGGRASTGGVSTFGVSSSSIFDFLKFDAGNGVGLRRSRLL